jgi:beta-lactamase regulating signal transducer with metallopeptidase domain
MQTFWEIVASNALLVVVLAVGVALLGRLWKNPLCLHLLWLLVLLKLVTPPLVTVPIALPASQAPLAAVTGDADQPPAYSSRGETSRQSTISATVGRQRRPAPDTRATARSSSDASYREIDWLTVCLWTWGVGIALFASLLAWRIGRFRQLFRGAEVPPYAVLGMAEGIAKRLELRQTPQIRMLPVRISPLVWSLDGRPRVFLPAELFAQLDQSAQEAILAHELAHVRRRDHWVRLLEVAVTTLFWWHPVAWWAARRLQELEDQCCDGMVVDMAPHGARTYATALLDTLDFLSKCPVAAPLGATVVQSSTLLARRISMLNKYAPTMRPTAGRLLLLASVASVPMALAFAAKQPEEPQRSLAIASAAEPAAQGQRPKVSAERAVATALNWLYRHQTPQGNWSIDYRRQCKGEACAGAGLARSDTAATAMALLPFLAAGSTPKSKGPYRQTVAKAIDWLIKQQKPDGDLSGGCEQPLYAHGLATIALCEAYGMTHDEQLGAAARLGVGYIERAQNEATGGWGPSPGDAGDTSTFGWQIMALKSAQLAGLPVKASVLDRAQRWLRSVAKGEKLGLYANQPGGEATPAMTAAGMFARQLMGAGPKDLALLVAKGCLLANLPDSKPTRNSSYWYCGTLALHAFSDADWVAWNHKLRQVLVETQVRQGCAAGSWDPDQPAPDAGNQGGGRLVTTSLSVLSLEVYYRYLPLFRVTTAVTPSGRAHDARAR